MYHRADAGLAHYVARLSLANDYSAAFASSIAIWAAAVFVTLL